MSFPVLLNRFQNKSLNNQEFLSLLNKRPEPTVIQGRELLHLQSIGGDSAELLLFGEIGTELDGNLFASEINFLGQIGIKNLLIKINSVGGKVFLAQGIVGEMLTTSMEITTLVTGIAMSASAFVAPMGAKRLAFDFATFMVHDPIVKGQEPDEKTAQVIKMAKDSIITMMISRSNLKREQLDVMMADETFFSAKEAKGFGLVDEVLTSGRKIAPIENATPIELMNSYNPKPKEITIKKNNMIEVTSVLGLNADSTPVNISKEIVSLISDKDAAEKKVVDLQSKLEVLDEKIKVQESAAKAERLEKATIKLNTLVLEKVISASSVPAWLELAMEKPELFEASMGSINIKAAKVIDKDSKLPGSLLPGITEATKDWDFQKWRKAPDNALIKLSKDHPETVEKLTQAFTKELEAKKELV